MTLPMEGTSFPMAVKRKDDETVVFSWILWSSRKVRDRGMKKVMADPQRRVAADQGDHFVEDPAGLKAVIGAGVNFPAALRLRTAEVAERKSGGKLALAVLARHAQNGSPNGPDAALVLPVNGLNEPALPLAQAELRARVLAGGDLEILEKGNHPIRAAEAKRVPGVGPRGCCFERFMPRQQGFRTWSSEAHTCTELWQPGRSLPHIGVSVT